MKPCQTPENTAIFCRLEFRTRIEERTYVRHRKSDENRKSYHMNRDELTERKRTERNSRRNKRKCNGKRFKFCVFRLVLSLFVFHHIDDVIKSQTEHQNHSDNREEFQMNVRKGENCNYKQHDK